MTSIFNAKIVQVAAYAIVVAASVFVALIGWLIIYPPTPGTEIKNIGVPEQAVAGEEIDVRITYCKSVPGTATSTFTLVTETQVFYFPPVESNRPTGCDEAVIPIALPVNVPPGTAHFELDIQREYNPLHSDTISAESDEFEIVAPKE